MAIKDTDKPAPVENYPNPIDLREHPEIKGALDKLAKSPKFQVDMSLMDEIEGLVSVAKESRAGAEALRLPKRYKTSEDLHKLSAFFAETQANRDRVIEIKHSFLELQRSLKILHKKFLGVIYQYKAISKLSPAPAREATIDYILEPLLDRMSKVDMIMNAASEADRNLGNTHFTLKELRAIGVIFIEGERAQRGV